MPRQSSEIYNLITANIFWQYFSLLTTVSSYLTTDKKSFFTDDYTKIQIILEGVQILSVGIHKFNIN